MGQSVFFRDHRQVADQLHIRGVYQLNLRQEVKLEVADGQQESNWKGGVLGQANDPVAHLRPVRLSKGAVEHLSEDGGGSAAQRSRVDLVGIRRGTGALLAHGEQQITIGVKAKATFREVVIDLDLSYSSSLFMLIIVFGALRGATDHHLRARGGVFNSTQRRRGPVFGQLRG